MLLHLLALAVIGTIPISGADHSADPPAMPWNGVMRVLSSNVTVAVPENTKLEIKPPVAVGFAADLIGLQVGGKLTDEKPLGKESPVFEIEAPASNGPLPTHLLLVGRDLKRHQRVLARVQVFTDRSATNTAKVQLRGERIVLSGADDYKAVYLWDWCCNYVGKITKPSEFSMDARTIGPWWSVGWWTIAVDREDRLLPVAYSEFWNNGRFHVDPSIDGKVITAGQKVVLEKNVSGIEISISPRTERIAGWKGKYLVYAGDKLVAKGDGPDLKVMADLSDVPSGKLRIWAVGICEDGVAYPKEASEEFALENPIWDAIKARDARTKQLEQMQRDATKVDEEIEGWYERAINEPAFRTYMVGRTYFLGEGHAEALTVGYLDSITVPGDPGHYLAECRKAIVRRAEARVQIGKLQKLLGLREAARISFESAIEDAGEDSSIGDQAKSELKSL